MTSSVTPPHTHTHTVCGDSLFFDVALKCVGSLESVPDGGGVRAGCEAVRCVKDLLLCPSDCVWGTFV